MKLMNASVCSLLLLVLFLFASTTIMPVAEAKVCVYPSRYFHLLCLRDKSCANTCTKEGFGGGYCHGLRRRCMCTKRC
uniref:Defensin 5 n=1 Tax=Allium cepa TaxID=4679 RepID=A0A7D5NM87_ALLCE|nr:defensin 5 [Allium cepa]